jgi:hypothetical protein
MSRQLRHISKHFQWAPESGGNSMQHACDMVTKKPARPIRRPPLAPRDDPERYVLAFFLAQASRLTRRGFSECETAVCVAAVTYDEIADWLPSAMRCATIGPFRSSLRTRFFGGKKSVLQARGEGLARKVLRLTKELERW